MRRVTGFTIIEMLVVVLVASVLAALSAPATGNLIKNNRLQSKTHAVMGDVLYARGEAITRKKQVILCRSADSEAPTPTCGGETQNWGAGGYLTFVDEDLSNTFSAGDLLLRRGAKAIGKVTLMINGAVDLQIRFSPDGSLNESGVMAQFAVCDDRPEASRFGRRIDVLPHGRPRIISGITDCTP